MRGGSRADRIEQLTQLINLRVDPSLLRLKTFDGCVDYFSGEFLVACEFGTALESVCVSTPFYILSR